MTKDRIADSPGGCECLSCGEIFIGEPWHSECRECYLERRAGVQLSPFALPSIKPKEMQA